MVESFWSLVGGDCFAAWEQEHLGDADDVLGKSRNLFLDLTNRRYTSVKPCLRRLAALLDTRAATPRPETIDLTSDPRHAEFSPSASLSMLRYHYDDTIVTHLVLVAGLAA